MKVSFSKDNRKVIDQIRTRLVSLGRFTGSGMTFTAPDCGGFGLPFAMLPNWVCAKVCGDDDDDICW